MKDSGRKEMVGMTGLVSVLNPTGYPPSKVEGTGLSPSLESLEDKTVCLVDGNFDNGDTFVEALRLWFGQHIPSVKTEVVRWREPFSFDPEASEKIKGLADAAIFGFGI
jgi:hypothetical protein